MLLGRPASLQRGQDFSRGYVLTDVLGEGPYEGLRGIELYVKLEAAARMILASSAERISLRRELRACEISGLIEASVRVALCHSVA